MWKVETRKNCKVCGAAIAQPRSRTYCSKKCRNKHYGKKYLAARNLWQRNKSGKYGEGKIQCEICGKWYRAVCTHVRQTHKIDHAEYKQEFGIDKGRGLITSGLKEVKREHVFANGTVKNLIAGMRTRYFKGNKQQGRYERSEETKNRLRTLYLFRKNMYDKRII